MLLVSSINKALSSIDGNIYWITPLSWNNISLYIGLTTRTIVVVLYPMVGLIGTYFKWWTISLMRLVLVTVLY